MGDSAAMFAKCCKDRLHVPIVLGSLTVAAIGFILYGMRRDREDWEMYKAYMRVEFLKTGILKGLIGDDHNFVRVCLENIRAQHKILSFISPPLANAVVFRRPERDVCTYAYLLTSLMVTCIFYGKDPDSLGKRVAKIIITSALMYPTSAMFPGLFMAIHQITSKTYRKDEEYLDFDDVEAMASSRLPDKFVVDGLGVN